MLKLSKKADYALIALRHLAKHYGGGSASASDIADAYRISTPLMAKVLQRLARHGLVTARHGASGGYTLARDPHAISALDAISAIDGPLSITGCVTNHGDCDALETCTVRLPLRRVNDTILQVLSKVTLSEICDDAQANAIVELRA